MSSPDERQGDAQARCSSYFCSLGSGHSVPCNRTNVLQTEVLEVLHSHNPAPELNEDRGADSDVRPSPARERNDLNNPIKGTSTDGPLNITNGNQGVSTTIPWNDKERQLVVSA